MTFYLDWRLGNVFKDIQSTHDVLIRLDAQSLNYFKFQRFPFATKNRIA